MFKKILFILLPINLIVLGVCDAIYQSQKATNQWAPLVFLAFYICAFFSVVTLLIVGFVSDVTYKAAHEEAKHKKKPTRMK